MELYSRHFYKVIRGILLLLFIHLLLLLQVNVSLAISEEASCFGGETSKNKHIG